MTLSIRQYTHEEDFEAISQFLIDSYRPGRVFSPWLQARWEYMNFHTFIWELDRTKIGVAEDNGKIVGMVNFESNEAEVFIQAHPDYPDLRFDLFDYAEATNFSGISRSTGRLFRVVYIDEFEPELEQMAQARGYEKWSDFVEVNSSMNLTKKIPGYTLPKGFTLQSLAEENDLRKINHVLWRGFDHPGPPPDEEIEGRAFMQQAPNFRKDLTIVAVSPDGQYVSFGGLWHIKPNRVAMVEPVATVPDFRRMGLGRAVVLEGLRRAAAEGAEIAWVGSGLDFYTAIGFTNQFKTYPWAKFLD